MKKLNSLYHKQYLNNKGYIASVGEGAFNHKFGGNMWDVSGAQITKGPLLLITLDIKDPAMKDFQELGIEELPFCCELNYVYVGRQIYQIDKNEKNISLLSIDEKNLELLPEEDQQLIPFPSKSLILKPMNDDDYPVDEESYYQCCDNFLGGKGVIRVLGPPVWMQEPERVRCNCGKEMDYVCSIGYEVDNEFCQLLDGTPFFPGELVHYFFVCKRCLKTATLVQLT